MQITYHAAPGDDREVDYLGLHLVDGESVEIPADADPAKVAKAKQNPRFEVTGGEVEPEEDPDLVKQAESLGIVVDKRWGNARLRAEIDKALAK